MEISFRNIHDFRGLVALQLQQCKIIEALFTAEAGRAQALVDLMEWQYGGKKSIPLSSKLQTELILSNFSSHISSPTLFLDRERDRDRQRQRHVRRSSVSLASAKGTVSVCAKGNQCGVEKID